MYASGLLAVALLCMEFTMDHNGIRKIGKKIHSLTSKLSEGLIQLGYRQINKTYFDTILINVGNVSMENINTYRRC